jgi:hypothetical protein
MKTENQMKNTPGTPPLQTLRCTNALRWKKQMFQAAPILGMGNQNILQQAWQCIETGEVVWKDVPVEEGKSL